MPNQPPTPTFAGVHYLVGNDGAHYYPIQPTAGHQTEPPASLERAASQSPARPYERNGHVQNPGVK